MRPSHTDRGGAEVAAVDARALRSSTSLCRSASFPLTALSEECVSERLGRPFSRSCNGLRRFFLEEFVTPAGTMDSHLQTRMLIEAEELGRKRWRESVLG